MEKPRPGFHPIPPELLQALERRGNSERRKAAEKEPVRPPQPSKAVTNPSNHYNQHHHHHPMAAMKGPLVPSQATPAAFMTGPRAAVQPTQAPPNHAYPHLASSSASASLHPSTGGNPFNIQPNRVPPEYWDALRKCGGSESAYPNTESVYSLLLSSGLPRDSLSGIWGLVNTSFPCLLTQAEFFAALALVAQVQGGKPPTLNGLEGLYPRPRLAPDPNPGPPQPQPINSRSNTELLLDLNLAPPAPTTQTAAPSSALDLSDEFGDFQEAPPTLPVAEPILPLVSQSSAPMVAGPPNYDALKELQLSDAPTPSSKSPSQSPDSLSLHSREFSAASNGGHSTSSTASVWREALEAALAVLTEAVELLRGVESSLLSQVLSSKEGGTYSSALAEVMIIASRIFASANQQTEDFGSTRDRIESVWRDLASLAGLETPIVRCGSDPSSLMDSSLRVCGLCLLQVEERSISHAGSVYHASCANFWLNMVQPSLPGLKPTAPLSPTASHA